MHGFYTNLYTILENYSIKTEKIGCSFYLVESYLGPESIALWAWSCGTETIISLLSKCEKTL